VAFPKIALAVPLLIAGMYLPAAGPDLQALPAGAVGMGHEGYSRHEIDIHVGQRVTFQNDSRWIHIIGPGHGGHLSGAVKHVPVDARLLMQQNDTYTTGRWNAPGRYQLTCSVHPEMNTTVVVTR
jgi:plastocyanin